MKLSLFVISAAHVVGNTFAADSPGSSDPVVGSSLASESSITTLPVGEKNVFVVANFAGSPDPVVGSSLASKSSMTTLPVGEENVSVVANSAGSPDPVVGNSLASESSKTTLPVGEDNAAVAANSAFSPNPVMGSSLASETTIRTVPDGEDKAPVARDATQRGSFIRPFADLAPRQKVMGVINAIAILRTKIALLDEMRTAFEPRTSGTTSPTPSQRGHTLPGPALAYGDCRLGILGFEVCRHLGFLQSDPMVAPSSTQSKLLTLTNASSLISSYRRGEINLKADPDLNSILGPEILDSAIRFFSACWNAQLFLPAFDTRGVNPEIMTEALNQADIFLFLTAMHAKKIIRFSRSDFDDIASWLAGIFSDMPWAEPPSMHSDSMAISYREEEPQLMEEGLDEKLAEQRDDPLSLRKSAFSGFLNRLFPLPSHQKSQDVQKVPAPTNAMSTLANSVGDISSTVTGAALNTVKAAGGEGPSDNEQEAIALEKTGNRLGKILSMIPDEVNGQF